ncbi:MAG: hypothetical protein M5U13_15690 [Thermoanaerobaculia bacterium]|nr:hypothetical protein [Thermoanaerobaculia bacterium]
MSPQRTRTRPGVGAGPETKTKQKGKPQSKAAVQSLREARAAALAAALLDAAAEGELTLGLPEEAELTGPDDLAAIEGEPELDLGDEDAPPADRVEPGEGDDLSWEEEAPREPDEPFGRAGFELVVGPDGCRFELPDWAWGWSGAGAAGHALLGELDLRFETYRKVAAWLTWERAAFLTSRDFWDLGPASKDELATGEIAVRQAGLVALAGLGVDESTLGRYLPACDLVWPDGSAPLALLFGPEARRGWAARAFWLAVGETKRRVEEREILQVLTAPKKKADRERLPTFDALARGAADATSALLAVCAAAEVAPREVVAAFGDRLFAP